MQRSHASCHASMHQSGIALVTSLIFLIVLTLLGVTAMQTTALEEKMAGNVRDLNLAFQASEAALREGEHFLQAAVLPVFDGTNGLHQPADYSNPALWEQDDIWNSASSSYSENITEVASQPKYIIEELAPIPDSGGSLASDTPLPDIQVYRVTARGEGGTSSTVVILQTTYKR